MVAYITETDICVHPSYYNTLDQIYHAQWAIPKLARLEVVRESVATLWPQGHATRLVQVAGTSGKGSTCRFLEMGLSLVGHAGALLSPHLFDYRERFSIDGSMVAAQDITAAWEQRIRPHCIRLALQHPAHVHTFHEIGILLALVFFEQYQAEWAVVETGVGGRYDQTTALDVAATVLTNVGRDHEHLLGQTQWQRALDKVGIARPDVPLFTSEHDLDTLHLIETVCRDVGAPLMVVGAEQVARVEQFMAASVDRIGLDGALIEAKYQHWNAALALEVMRYLFPTLSVERMLEHMLTARLPGRFWQIEPGVFADVAHNPDKIRALAGELERRFPNQGKICVVGVSGSRSAVACLEALLPVAKTVIITGASFKGREAHLVKTELASIAPDRPTLVIPDPREAFAAAQSLRQEQDLIILTGSTYLIDQVFNPDDYLRTLNATYGWRTRPK